MQIKQVQKQRGRSNNTLKVTDDKGKICFVPEDEGNRHYRIVQNWLQEGGEILPPEPKSREEGRHFAYSDHPCFNLPDDKNILIWRYMNFEKFFSILENNLLYFSRGTSLIKFDRAEGSLPEENLKIPPEKLLNKLYPSLKGETLEQNNIKQIYEGHRNLINSIGHSFLINCWHMNPAENYALWKIYGSNRNAVAIQSKLEFLKECFGPYEDYDVFIGQLSYLNYLSEEIDESNYFNLFLNKRKFFEYEKEVRCIILDDGDINFIPSDEPNPAMHLLNETPFLRSGFHVPIDLEKLIDKIIVSPFSEMWFFDLVCSTMAKFNIPKKKVSRSNI